MDDLDLFLDHWIISREDGSHIVNGKFEDFEKNLRDFIRLRELFFNGDRDADTH